MFTYLHVLVEIFDLGQSARGSCLELAHYRYELVVSSWTLGSVELDFLSDVPQTGPEMRHILVELGQRHFRSLADVWNILVESHDVLELLFQNLDKVMQQGRSFVGAGFGVGQSVQGSQSEAGSVSSGAAVHVISQR